MRRRRPVVVALALVLVVAAAAAGCATRVAAPAGTPDGSGTVSETRFQGQAMLLVYGPAGATAESSSSAVVVGSDTEVLSSDGGGYRRAQAPDVRPGQTVDVWLAPSTQAGYQGAIARVVVIRR